MDRRFDIASSELAALRRSAREIERAIERKRQEQLKSLPELVALNTHDELVVALKHFCSPELRARIDGFDPKPPVKRRASRYNTEMRIRVRAELESGKSIARVAAETGVSVATVMKWKKEMGLQVRRRRRVGTNGAHQTDVSAPNSGASPGQLAE